MKTLNKIKIKYQDAKDIMIAFLFNDPNNINILSDFLEKNAILYQYLFGNLFPKCFSRINDYGINAKTLFNSYYHNFNIQKNMISWAKQENLQSPINMTTLNDNDDNDDNDDNNDENKENIKPKEQQNEEQKEKKKLKRKIKNKEEKKQKREAKKKRLLEQLNENTEKLKKLKKSNK